MVDQNKITFDPEGHRYFIDGEEVLSVTQVLMASGIVDPSFYTEHGRARGQNFHLASRFLDENDLDWSSVPPKMAARLQDYQQIKTEHGMTYTAIEEPIGSSIYKVCGTPDRINHEKKFIWDLKSGEPEEWHALQMAGYEAILESVYGPGWRRVAIYVNGDGKPRLREYPNRADVGVFRSALSVLQWKMAKQGFNPKLLKGAAE